MADPALNGGAAPAAGGGAAARQTTPLDNVTAGTYSEKGVPNEVHFGGATYKRLSGSLLTKEEQELDLVTFGPMQIVKFLLSFAIPGVGMFLEAYYIFSIGNIKPIYQHQYPNCWKKFTTCSKTLTQLADYIQIVGIIIGMCTMGFIGDKVGRKIGSMTTVSIMLIGAILLTFQGGKSEQGQLIMYIVAQFVFGYGTGGEYPMASGSAAERAEAGGREAARRRGSTMVLTFSMQGVGNFVNTLVLIALLYAFNQGGLAPNYEGSKLNGVWRTAFAAGIIVIIFAIGYRYFILKESEVWKSNNEKAIQAAVGKKTGAFYQFSVLLTRHWSRMLSTAGCWFLWDFGFYGNKLFQSEFIAVLSPGASLSTNLAWTLLNSGVALIGYYFSAALVDNRWFGRVRIQLLGFAMSGILYMICAAKYNVLILPNNIKTFQFLYFFSSFWGQFGPNCTTWILAGELYPTAIRTTAHGLSAGTAKLGALWATVWFNYINNHMKFWLTASMNFGGLLLTWLATPEPLRVPLSELDRKHAYEEAGKIYHGEAINPKNLSLMERTLQRRGVNYNKQLDHEDLFNDHFVDPVKPGSTEYATV